MADKHSKEYGLFGTRACPAHDPNSHWEDDFAYLHANDRDNADNKFTDLIELLSKHGPEGNPDVFRFALVFVNTDTGLTEVLANPGATELAIMNLLSRAASILAFQQEQHIQQAQARVMGALSGAPAGSVPLALPEDDSTDDGSGQYL